MERFAFCGIPFLCAYGLLRLLIISVRKLFRFGVYLCSGLLCLCFLNIASPVTGIHFPLNALTVAAAGFGGLPAIAIMALLMFIP